MNEETGGISENDFLSNGVLPTQSLLVTAVTKKVLEVLSKEDKRGDKRRKRQQKRPESKRLRALNTSGTCISFHVEISCIIVGV